jgi:hypothetical protein
MNKKSVLIAGLVAGCLSIASQGAMADGGIVIGHGKYSKADSGTIIIGSGRNVIRGNRSKTGEGVIIITR